MLQQRSPTRTSEGRDAFNSSLARSLPVLACAVSGSVWYVSSHWLAGAFFIVATCLVIHARFREHVTRVRQAMAWGATSQQNAPETVREPVRAATESLLNRPAHSGWMERPVGYDV